MEHFDVDGGEAGHQPIYIFGPFRLDPIGRTLFANGVRVPIAARLFDLLLYLVENRERLVERDELIQALWPGRVVEDSNLAKAVSSLRDALKLGGQSEGYIVTVPGRGYRFGARVLSAAHRAAEEAADTPVAELPAADKAATSPGPVHRHWSSRGLAPWALGLAGLLAVVVLSVGGWLEFRKTPFAPPPRSVAVLPFSHSNPADEEFSDGVSEELINALGRVGALRVAGRMSSFFYKGRQIGVGEIGRQLDVATVLEGSVRRDGTKLRVTAQLVDAVTGYQLWAEEYDHDQAGLLPLEQQIASAVIASLKIVLDDKSKVLLTPGGTDDPRAFDDYLAGMASLRKADADTNDAAIAAFNAAIAQDPHYALAYAQRARVLAYRAVTSAIPDLEQIRDTLEAARQDAQKSVALAPELGSAHAALALVLKLGLSQFATVQAELQRAISLSPNDVNILLDDSLLELEIGHKDTAIASARHAAALDPLTPMSYKILSEILTYDRRFDEALEALHRAETLRSGDQSDIDDYRSTIQQLRGDAAGAARTCAPGGNYREVACLAWAYHKLGRKAEAETALAKLHAMLGDNGAYIYAGIAAEWGERRDALRWLQTAYDTHDAGLVLIRVDPFLDTLRSAPEYLQIERALDFPN